MDLEAQRDQLEALAKAQKVDLAPVKKLPDDPRLRVLGLATLLGIDAMAALRGDVPVKRLLTEARKQERAQAKYDRQERKRLRESGIEIDPDQGG
jgi:hypothetical protein